MTEIGLVSCVKTKREEPATPKNLYTSDYFNKMQAYAEQYHDDWWILSVKHGLLDPDGDPIEPYDETLSGARIVKKREWAEQVAEELDDEGLLSEEVTVVYIEAVQCTSTEACVVAEIKDDMLGRRPFVLR